MGTKPEQAVIVISRTDRLGDLLLSFPAFYRVREMFPEARIIVLIRKYTADLLYGQAFIDRVICIDDFEFPDLVQQLRNEKPDYFIALFSNDEIGKLAKLSGAKYRIGPLSKLHSWLVYNEGIRQKRSHARKNEAEYNLDLVNRLSTVKSAGNAYTKLFYDAEHREYAANFLASTEVKPSVRIVVINPFSGGSAKNLSLQQYLALGKFIIDREPLAHVVYIATKSDAYQPIQLVANGRQSLFINEGSILNLVALLDRASLYVGASTGPTHIAAFLNKQVVAIYPKILNQSPIRWGLLGCDNVCYIQPDVPCSQKFGCKRSCKYYDCFKSLDVSRIADLCCEYLA
jgi:ADP-heptose:LPS heptosyltransferase